MEPAPFMIGTLAAGAIATSKNITSQAVKDTYASLKKIVKRRFTEKKVPPGEMVLTQYEEELDVWKAPLKNMLVKAETHKAKEVLKAVEALKQVLVQTHEGREAVSKCLLNIQNSQVGVIGDKATVHGGIHFGGKKDD